MYTYKSKFYKDLGIASLHSDQVRVLTLLQDPDQKKASINAYEGARYSRSADSIVDIAREIVNKGVDASAQLEKIFHGYGHRSVASMAHLLVYLNNVSFLADMKLFNEEKTATEVEDKFVRLFACIENVPMLMDPKFFGENPMADGQSRSTRYQDFSKATWRSPFFASEKVQAKYNELMQSQVDTYITLYSKTYEALANFHQLDLTSVPKQILNALSARTLDTARYLLPIGLNTSFGAVMPASCWSEYIGRLRGSSQEVEREIGEALFSLLVGTPELAEQGYIPEADGLIRHADADSTREETTRTIRNLLKEAMKWGDGAIASAPSFSSYYPEEAPEKILTQLLLLVDPSFGVVTSDDLLYSAELWSLLGELVFSNFSQYKMAGEILEGVPIEFSGYADLGSLKDLNRHRPWSKQIPLLNNSVDIKNELFGASSDMLFSICPYLGHKDLEELASEYVAHFEHTYMEIKNFIQLAEKEMTEQQLTEYVRYLLPHAHTTRYTFTGTINQLIYLVNTRIRPGAHISCRKIVDKWVRSLVTKGTQLDYFFKAFVNRLKKPDPYSLEEFLDRS